MDYIWYEQIKSNRIEQGDFIENCQIPIPPPLVTEGEEISLVIKEIDSIILSQTCDLINNKIQIVLVCPYFTIKDFIEHLPEDQKSKKGLKKNIENLRKGHLPGYHLLNKNDEQQKDYLVVDFRNVYGVDINNLRHIADKLGSRTRLLPPYREHLSQAFARYFMRVGLPQDIKIEGYY